MGMTTQQIGEFTTKLAEDLADLGAELVGDGSGLYVAVPLDFGASVEIESADYRAVASAFSAPDAQGFRVTVYAFNEDGMSDGGRVLFVARPNLTAALTRAALAELELELATTAPEGDG